jgi:hypothetical protein
MTAILLWLPESHNQGPAPGRGKGTRPFFGRWVIGGTESTGAEKGVSPRRAQERECTLGAGAGG